MKHQKPVDIFDTIWEECLQNNRVPDPPKPSWVKALADFSEPTLGKKFLEAGCGTGVFSAELLKYGIDCFLLDLSTRSIELSRKIFELKNIDGKFIIGDLFSLPFKSESFDIVWNSGVLEHFSSDVTKLALKEMERVTKRSGTIVVLVPSGRGIFYRSGKWIRERLGRWHFGYERPISTFKGSEPKGWEVTREIQVGVFSQTSFLPPPFRQLFYFLVKILCNDDDQHPFWQKIFGGYLLVSEIKFKGIN
jgi:ubiquinone/menaquinone biosynthesis C-methylase UbiE